MCLPIDILQKIFLQLCPPDEPIYFPPGRNEPRLVLAHVSSQWRAIMFAMPELWNDIIIDQASIKDGSSCLHNLLPLWLSNSSSSTLAFSFTKGYDCFPTLEQFIIPIIDRCSVLSLELGNVSFARLLALPSGSFASLKAINVSVGFGAEYLADDQLITAFHSSPNLKHVALNFSGECINIMHFNLPWHQLFTLTIKWCTVPADIFLDVLRECTSLHSCHIVLSPIGHDVLQKIIPLSADPVASSSLHTLNLRFSTSDHHPHFLAAIRLPHLHECEVSCLHGLPWSASTLQSFFQPLSHTLEALILKDLSSAYEHMDEILTLLPHLTQLCLLGEDDLPLAALSKLSEGAIAPRLTGLSLGHINAIGPLIDLLEGRLAAARAVDGDVAAFRVVSGSCSSPGGVNEAERVAVLRATGMTIEILFWDEAGNTLYV